MFWDNKAILSWQKKRFQKIFDKDGGFSFCHNVQVLLLALVIKMYDPSYQRLFINLSKQSLSCALLHNRNLHASAPMVHSAHAKENYRKVNTVMPNKLWCSSVGHLVDPKMIHFLQSHQKAYIWVPCFLRLWDNLVS